MTDANQQPAGGGGMKELKRKARMRVGQMLNQYRLEGVLGVGGMASVYSASDPSGRRVAIKIMHVEFAHDESVKERFLREGRVAMKVDHDGRVEIYGEEESERGEPYLVMEMLEGESLQDMWKRMKRKVPVDQALYIARSLCDVLQPYHDIRIIHRDLKPANVFITNENVVKLLDFGVAQMRETGGEALTKAGTALGTPSYMSPEQAMGKSDTLDGRSDIFAVGATLYAILSGKRLHHGKSDNEAFILAATQPAPSLARVAPNLPVEVIALVDKSLKWDRRKRFNNAHEMRDAADRIIRVLEGPANKPAGMPAPPGSPSGASGPGAATPVQSRGRLQTPLPGRAPSPPTPAPPKPPTPPAPTGSPAHETEARRTPPIGTRGAATPQPAATPTPSPPQRATPEPRAEADEVVAGAYADAAEGRSYDDEADFGDLEAVFKRLEKLFPTMRQYGPVHPETRAKVRPVFRAFQEVFKEFPKGLTFQVQPFCFTYKGEPVWEPPAPVDLVPYNLCVAGVEDIQITPDLSLEEVQRFCHAILMDPARSGLGGGDIVAAIWDARFDNIFCHVREDFAEADAVDQETFVNDTEELMGMATEDLAEVAVVAVTTDIEGFAKATAGRQALELDGPMVERLAAELEQDRGVWMERFTAVAADIYSDVRLRGDPQTFLRRIGSFGQESVQWGRYEELFLVHKGIVTSIREHSIIERDPTAPVIVTAAMFSSATLSALIKFAAKPYGATEHTKEILLNGLEYVFGILDGRFLDDAFPVANRIDAGPVLDLLVRYMVKAAAGKEKTVLNQLELLRTDLAMKLLQELTYSRDPKILEAVKPLLRSRNAAIQCEATALVLDNPQHLARQLLKVMEKKSPVMTDAALGTLLRHNCRQAGPGLVQLIDREEFVDRAPEQRSKMLETLHELHPSRMETLCVQMLERHGMLADENEVARRTLAAEMLGRFGDTAGARDALEGATKLRPWNTQEVRDTATKALEDFHKNSKARAKARKKKAADAS